MHFLVRRRGANIRPAEHQLFNITTHSTGSLLTAAPSSPVTCTQSWLSTAAYLLCCSSTAALISSTYLIATASIDHGRSCGWVREDRQIQLNCRRWILESQKRFWLHLLLTKRRVCGVIQLEEKSGCPGAGRRNTDNTDIKLYADTGPTLPSWSRPRQHWFWFFWIYGLADFIICVPAGR